MREGVGGDVGCGAVVAHMSVFGCVGVGVRSGLGAGAAQGRLTCWCEGLMVEKLVVVLLPLWLRCPYRGGAHSVP